MPCQKSHKLKDFVMGLIGGGHFVLFLINCYGVLLGIKLHSLYGDSRSAHRSRNFFNTIPIGPIYFLFTMDLEFLKSESSPKVTLRHPVIPA